MGLKEKIREYFQLNNTQKNEILLEILNRYLTIQREEYGFTVTIEDLIQADLEDFIEMEEYELVQALTDIKNQYDRVMMDLKDKEMEEIIQLLKKK